MVAVVFLLAMVMKNQQVPVELRWMMKVGVEA